VSFFNSCSSDRDEEKTVTPKYNIVGKWKAMQYKDTDGTWKSMAILNWYSQFNTDGTYVTYNGNTFNGTYTYDNDSKITAKAGGETVNYTIHSMSGNIAEAEMYYSSSPNDKVTYKLEKQ
ncbi:MAG: hypothetical protein L0G16_07995, partial [Weeksellaceae bacterium]|nr:hypothetical protein [Weeksellaceae bacterium]